MWLWETQRIPYPVATACLWVLCRLVGHHPGLDHCCRPEHDLCIRCHRSMPGRALERAR